MPFEVISVEVDGDDEEVEGSLELVAIFLISSASMTFDMINFFFDLQS